MKLKQNRKYGRLKMISYYRALEDSPNKNAFLQ
jgi:hypothetical protein